MAIFSKNDVTGGSNFAIKCSSQTSYVANASYDVNKASYWPRNAQILENGFRKPQNWKSSRYLSNFKFSGAICDEI